MAEQDPPKNESQEPQPPQATPTPAHEMAELHDLWERYGRSVITGVVLALVLVVALTTYRGYREGKKDQASAALASAAGAEDFEQILARHGRTPAAPIATLALARSHFEDRRYDDALAAYDRFQRDFPEHPMRAAVELARAQTLEAAGRLAEAEAAFRAFHAAHPADHYLQPAARLGIGRCLEQQGNWEEARAVYEDFLASEPAPDWAGQAEMALRFVRRSLSAQQQPAP